MPPLPPLLPGEVRHVGVAAFGDMHTALGYQVQPAYAATDILHTQAMAAYGLAENVKVDPLHGCVYAQPLFVPHNQKAGVAGITDQDTQLLAGVPSLVWDTLEIGGAAGQASGTVHHKKDPHWGFQYLDVTCKTDAGAKDITLAAQATMWTGADGQSHALKAQELELWLTRSLFTRVAEGEDEDSTVAVLVKVGGYWYRVELSAAFAAQVSRASDHEDPAAATYKKIKGDMRGGASEAQQMGPTGGARPGEQLQFRVTAIGGRVSMNLSGGAIPLLDGLRRETRTSIARLVSPAVIEVAPGTGERFPPAPFVAHVWDGGAPTRERLRTVTVTGRDGDTLLLSGGISGVRAGGTIDILEPRIEAVRIEAAAFTELGWSGHVKKFAAGFSWKSPARQLGFVPAAATPVHYTLHDTAGAGHVREGEEYAPLFPDGAKAVVTTYQEGTIAAYQIDGTNPPPSGGGDEDDEDAAAYPKYAGQEYSDETLALTRVTLRVDGFEEPPTPGAYVNSYLGVGDDTPVKAITQTLTFNPDTLTVDNTCQVVLDNVRGIADLAGRVGVTVAGNLAVAVRLGYEHQRPLSDPTGGLGFPRFYGFCPVRSFSTPPGGGSSLLTLSCVDQMAWLAKTQIAAPPDLDGNNHYWAMAYLAQAAGVPLRRMAFAPLVPDEPFGASRFDTEPYYLPLGFGDRPWTPVNRTLSTLELMQQIRSLTGFLLFFDASGMLRYEPWIPVTQLYAGPVRRFTGVPDPAQNFRDYNGGLCEVWDLSVQTSTVDTRNQTLLVGIDSETTWEPIVTKLEDAASISSPPGQQPFNYLGFKAPFVWLDSRFANAGFAQRSALKLHQWLRQSAVTVTFTCWPQHDLYVGDLIQVFDWRTGLEYVPLFIMSMTTTVSVAGGVRQESCSITARFLDAEAISPY